MEILITNDDGWGAEGILALTDAMRKIGHVTVVAPDGPRSGMSNAISVNKPMTLRRLIGDWTLLKSLSVTFRFATIFANI